ncbi:MAG: hypothetical protein EA395_16260 [Phormidium sp. GEM2.Bin31]|nr:hypothetical protein [Phormidium sp. BM_Day4_Bin.17]TVR04631.1 MAG: hypothetical protein EA395_16260 [Phormidium sp. GEM2.Bin31]UCJ13158.1 MAG: hypothetical protein JWS08_05085 [Phormidium sp. PBR-2020]
MSDRPPSLNVWHYKPWWCQPWSIVLTGVGLIGASWLLFHRLWLTGLVAIPLGAWMGYFLLLFPRLVAQSGQFPQDRSEDERG